MDEIICRQFVEMASDYLEGAVGEEDLELVEEHLAMCDWCREYLDQMKTTSAALAEAAPSAPSDATLRALLGAFRSHTRGDAPR
jgi:predicted anti-sigma-YlaC factor YlaD